nr:hypothetical protein [Tanacetum cinerariifolium]
MVNTRSDTDLTATVQNALQAMLPRIREEIREDFRTGSGSSNVGGNPTPVTIHTWLERFNKQKPNSFEKATVPVDAENWISHMEKIFDVMGGEDGFKTRLAVYKFEAEQERLKREYHSIRQTSSETSTEFMQRFLRLAGFLGAAAGTEEEQAKNFQWGLRRSTLNHLMCMSYTDVAQVANDASNYEILHEIDDQDTERPDKRVVVVVAAVVVVIVTTPVRSMMVVIMTGAPGRPAKTPLKVLRLLLLGASSCPEEPSKSKEALHELRTSLNTCLTNGMVLLLQALLFRSREKLKKEQLLDVCPRHRDQPGITTLGLLVGFPPSQGITFKLINIS